MRFRHTRAFDPGGWPPASGRTRVVVENPDRSELWAYAEALRSAGYEVATCDGPKDGHGAAASCPLLSEGRCSLVDGADVVVSTSALPEIRSILSALGSKGSPPVVLEAPPAALDEYRKAAGAAIFVACPVTEEILRGAVAEAEASARP